MTARSSIVVVLMCLPGIAVAESSTVTVYRSVDANGVVSFSDEHTDGATTVELETVAPRPEDVERAADLYEQQLELIGVLEADRRANEANAERRRQTELEIARVRAAAQVRDIVEVEPRYVYAPWYAPRPYPGHPHHGGHGYEDPPRPQPPAKPSPSNSRPLGIGSR